MLRRFPLLPVLLLALSAAGAPPAAPAAPLERRFAGEGAEVSLRVEPGEVRPEADCEAVVRAAAPEPLRATLPEDLADRFEGFEATGSYADEEGAVHIGLSPVPGAQRYRVRPFAVRVEDAGSSPARVSWLVTEAVDLPEAPPGAAPAEAPSADLSPAWIAPSARRVAARALCALGAAAALALLAFGVSRLRRARRVRRMTPRERALRELEALLARGLPGRGRFKDYYVELTMVVRRYVERRYGIRAPRRTTEEFLAEAGRAAAFDAATVRRLADFLEAADLVKFAGARATEETAGEAAGRARAYLEAESAAPPPAPAAAGGPRP